MDDVRLLMNIDVVCVLLTDIFTHQIQDGARNVTPLIVHITHFLLLQNHLTSGTEIIHVAWKIVPSESL